MENNLQTLGQKENITSLELVEQINLFRQKEGNKSKLEHYNLLKIIRDEFIEEINAVKIYAVEYTDKKGEKRPMFVLTFNQAKQILMRESRFVRRAVIEYIEKLENALKNQMNRNNLKQIVTDPDFAIALLNEIKADKEKIGQLTQTIQEQAPKVVFANAVSSSKTTILIGELAKIIKQNGIDIGQQRLFKFLRDNGYLMSRGNSYNLPTQKSMELGLFEINERTLVNPDGSIRIIRTTKITGKGQQYILNLFLKNKSEEES